MSAPLIWIVAPAVLMLVLLFLQRWPRLVTGIATAFCGLLTLTALTLPIGLVTRLGPWMVEMDAQLVVLGRRFILENGDRPYLALLYGMGVFWFFGSLVVRTRRLFLPLGLGIIALMVAAMAVQPFLYAAVLIEAAVLFSIPILARPGRGGSPAVLRYLIFQTLALPFILFAGWAAANIEANPAESRVLVQAVMLLGLGFAFWLAVFPLHSWVPMLLSAVPIYEGGFVMGLLPMAVILLMLSFMDNFTWLRTYPLLTDALRLSGILMIVSSGIWAAFEKNAARLLGYAVIFESGFIILSISLGGREGLGVFAIALLPRILGLALWALALAVLGNQGVGFDFESLEGQMRNFPFATSGLILAYFSIAGLPSLAGFPMRIALFESAAQQSLATAIWIIGGSLGFLVAGFRLLWVLLAGQSAGWKMLEKWPQVFLLLGGEIGLLVMGLFPRLILPGMLVIMETFKKL